MGAFTAEELANAANSLIDFHIKGKTIDQIKQVRPAVATFTKKQKTFPGGKEFITTPVRGAYTTTLMGFSHDDDVAYRNPANTKRAAYNWKEHHCGIQFTGTELKNAGISIVDSMDGANTKKHSGSDAIVLTDVLNEKIYDMMEGSMVDFSKILWRDGSADPTVFPGIPALIKASAPTTGTTGGIDRSLNSWWRNRASLGLSVTTPADMAISRKLQREIRQLRRYNSSAQHVVYAGEAFIDAMEQEARSKGDLTHTGWASQGTIDLGVSDISMKGLKLVYEPYLDDLGLEKYCYVVDHASIFLYVMDGEDWKPHTPARPASKYVFYRALTWTGGLVAKQLNSSGVYSIV